MKRRWEALDRLRALAVVLMIQGHTFNVVLSEATRAEPWWRWHRLVHGLTAPMFLMGAGLAFALTTYPHYEKHRRPSEAFWSRMRRYGLLLLLGYGLQVPGFSLFAAWDLEGEAWSALFRIGPLHLIGLTLGLVQISAFVLPTARLHALFWGAMGTLVAVVSPLVWNAHLADGLPLPLGTWLDRSHDSLFPLFPWGSFPLLAVFLGYLAQAKASVPARGQKWAWLVGGLGALAASYYAYRVHWNPYGEHDFWNNDPLYVVFRAGAVAVLLAFLWYPVRRQDNALDRGLAILAQHSLLAYVGHLLLLYGTRWTPSAMQVLDRQRTLGESIAIFLAVFATTAGMIAARRWWLRSRDEVLRDAREGAFALAVARGRSFVLESVSTSRAEGEPTE